MSTSPYPRWGHTRQDGRWFTYDVAPFATAPLVPWDGDVTSLTHDVDRMGNDRLSVTFADDGSISSLVDLTTGREHAAPYLNRLVLHRDRWSYFDAWDIDEGWLRRDGEVLEPVSTNTFRDGPRLMRRHVFVHGRTRIEQDLVLTPGQPYLLVENRIDWQERHRMLRAHHAPAARSDEVACEIQLGHLMRSTREDTPRERAETEVCAHRWVDLTTPGPAPFGLSLLNDGRYGHRAKGGEVSLNLLRAPIYPDPRADRGRHEVRYALYPHEGGLVESETMALAADLDAPLLVTRGVAAGPVVAVTPSSVVLDTITRSADGQALVLRLHEAHGMGATARLDLSGLVPVGGVRAVTLLEDDLGPVDPAAVPFSPFEIRTLRVERG